MGGCVLIAGAHGLVGDAVAAHYATLPGWEIIGLSRRPPAEPGPGRHIAVDLRDGADCAAKLGGLRGVTHIVYAALFEKPDLGKGWLEADQIETNRAMLANLLAAVEPASPGLRHLALLQGTKAYGVHLGQMPIPGRESAPRHMHPNFYWAQEDLLRARRAAGVPWRFTVLRPQVVIGHAIGSAMNMLAACGAYAAISRELGLPLVWPGGPPRITEATDARLLARAIAWAGQAESAADRTFNVTNGDVFTWEQLFPPLARAFGMEMGAPHPMPVELLMRDKAPVWDRIVAKYGLQPIPLAALIGSSWQFADFAFSRPGQTSSLLSTIAIRQAGFHDCIDTLDMWQWWLAEWQRRKLLPP